MSIKPVKESDVLASCLQWLTLKGVFHFRSNNIPTPLPNGKFRRFTGMKGMSDILGILPFNPTIVIDGYIAARCFGVLLAVEVKKPGGKLRKEQTAFLARVNELGGVGVCVSSLAELEEALSPYLAK